MTLTTRLVKDKLFRIKTKIFYEYHELIEKETSDVLSNLQTAFPREELTFWAPIGSVNLPVYTFISSVDAVGGLINDYLPFAVAIRLGYNAMLILDDIVDGEDFTDTGKPTINYSKGIPYAVLVENESVFYCFKTALLHLGHLPSPRIIKALEALARGGINACHANLLDLILTNKKYGEVTYNEYLDMIYLKDILSMPMRTGAILGGGNNTEVERLTNFGFHLAVAVQLLDDYMDFPSDLESGKKNIVALHLLQRLQSSTRKWIIDTLNKKPVSAASLGALCALAATYKSADYVHQLIINNIKKAIKSIESLKPSRGKKLLEDYAVSFQDLCLAQPEWEMNFRKQL